VPATQGLRWGKGVERSWSVSQVAHEVTKVTKAGRMVCVVCCVLCVVCCVLCVSVAVGSDQMTS
jgi:hypothetical protein